MQMSGTVRLRTVEGEGLLFEARVGSAAFALDSGAGVVHPSPVQSLLASLGACTAMDVIGILRKKRQRVTGYEVHLEGERAETHPRAFTRVVMVHRVTGFAVRAAAVEEAVRLSETKYCSVQAMLRPAVAIESRIEVIEAGAPPAPA